MNRSDSWYQLLTPHLEWLNPRMKLDVPRYVAELLDTMIQAGSDTLVYCFDSGGRPLYDSELAPTDEHVGKHDLLLLLRQETKKRGLNLFISFLGSLNLYAAHTYPTWRVRDPQGGHQEHVSIRVCNNSPYADYLSRQIGEVVRKFRPEGIYLEGIVAAACYCAYCREKFLREYGRELPTGEASQLWNDEQFTDFRFQSMEMIFRRARQAIDREAPETLFIGCGGLIEPTNLRRIRRYVDAISMERQWGYGLALTALTMPLHELGLHTQIARAETRKPVYSSVFIHKHVDRDYAPRGDDHLRLNTMCLLQAGATVQFHTQNAFEIDQTILPVVRELNGVIKKMRPYLLSTEIVGHAALLDWADPQCPARQADPALIGGARAGTYLDDSFRGYYRALLEHHVPTRIVTIEDINDGELDKYTALVLANTEHVDKATREKIKTYVENGGGLVMTYRTDRRYGGDRAEDLTHLAGVTRRYGEIINPTPEVFVPHLTLLPQTYYGIVSDDPAFARLKGRLLSFKGSYIEFEVGSDTSVLAKVIDYDYSRMHPDHTVIGWYPWEPIRPLMVGREVGKGRAMYIGAELDGASLRQGDADALSVLAGAVQWVCRGREILQTNVPPSVEITLHQSADHKKRCAVLTNQTTNQRYPDPIRYVVPIRDVDTRLCVGLDKVKHIETATGQPVTWGQVESWVTMRVGELRTYEALLIDLS